jgi:hypothetical protein
MLDALQAHLADGRVRILGEVTEEGLERLLAERPGLLSAFDVIRVRPLELAETIQVARSSLAQTPVTVAEESLSEAFELTRQFIPDSAPPGSLLRLLADTADDVLEQRRTEIETGDSCVGSRPDLGFRSRCWTATHRSISTTCGASSSGGFSTSARRSKRSSSELPSSRRASPTRVAL